MHNFDNVAVSFRVAASGVKYMYLRADYNDRSKPSTWFCFNWNDFVSLSIGKMDACTDGYHVCVRPYGGAWMFFDVEVPREPIAKREITIQTVIVPERVTRVLIRYGRLLFRRQGTETDWTVELTMAHRVRWADRYGAGKGDVEVVVDPRAQALYDKRLHDDKLAEQIERLKSISRNSTATKWQTAKLHISPDSPHGLYFSCRDPKGYQIMNGAVINHGTEEKPDWSTHT